MNEQRKMPSVLYLIIGLAGLASIEVMVLMIIGLFAGIVEAIHWLASVL
jgi:hypothetical protein